MYMDKLFQCFYAIPHHVPKNFDEHSTIFFSCDHSLLPHHFMCSTYEHANLANQIYYKIEKLTIDRATTKQATAYWEKSSKFPCPYVNI
jgi:hypothetical protein